MTLPEPVEPRRCDYEGSNYQETFWDSGERLYEDLAEAAALRRLLPPSGSLLLEIGAGAGRNTPRYQGHQKVVLLDYSLSQLIQARQRLGANERYLYVAADVFQMPFVSGLFDTATMIRVLHHLTDGRRAFAEIRRVLQPQGVFVLEYANKLNAKAIGRYLAGRQAWSPFDPQPVQFVELNFNFHPKTTRSWLVEKGFQIEKQRAVSFFRIELIKRAIDARLLARVDSLLQPIGALALFSPSLFVRSRAVGASLRAGPGEFFRCPACGQVGFHRTQSSLDCSTCGRIWPIEDGIYNFKQQAD